MDMGEEDWRIGSGVTASTACRSSRPCARLPPGSITATASRPMTKPVLAMASRLSAEASSSRPGRTKIPGATSVASRRRGGGAQQGSAQSQQHAAARGRGERSANTGPVQTSMPSGISVIGPPQTVALA